MRRIRLLRDIALSAKKPAGSSIRKAPPIARATNAQVTDSRSAALRKRDQSIEVHDSA
jgi:uncharacterized protein (DUF2342 family)